MTTKTAYSIDNTLYEVHKSKYNAKKTLVDGIIFHSMAEANRYKTLKLLERAGELCDLKLQVPFEFILNGRKLFTYYTDFTYKLNEHNAIEWMNYIEDVKGMTTPLYRLKKKLIEAQHGITISEYPAKKKVRNVKRSEKNL